MLQTFPPKQPGEEWLVAFDFSRPLGDTVRNPDAPENIGAIESVSATNLSTGEDATIDVTDVGISRTSGQVAYVWLKGGVTGTRYKITLQIRAASSQQIFEIDAVLPIRET